LDDILHPTMIGTFAFIAGLLAESWYSWRFLKGLKTYPDLWEHSGYRSLATDSNLIGAWETIRYLKGREYLKLEQTEEIEFCEAHRIPVIYSYFFGVIGVCSFFISIFIFGWPPAW
jgi:hypothetical protein